MVMVNIRARPLICRCAMFAASLGLLYTVTSFFTDTQRPPIDPTQSTATTDTSNLAAVNSTGLSEPPFQIFAAEMTTLDIVSPLEIAEKTLLIIKTGIDVCQNRIPVHADTTLKWFPHHIVYADGSTNINGVKVHDVISYIPKSDMFSIGLEGYLARKEAELMKWGWGNKPISIEGSNIGWSIDKFKNTPAFAHAFMNFPDMDWFMMIDGDSMVFPSTISAATAGMDPDDPHFLGRDVGWHHDFPHGGSGLLLSRGALKLIFGETERTALAAISKNMDTIVKMCCGDKAFSELVFSSYKNSKDDLEFRVDHGFFQGGSLVEQKCSFEYWCQPVGTFHHTENWENQQLAEWYESLLEKNKDRRYLPTYFDFYKDFIMPHVVEELPGWFMHFRNEDWLKKPHYSIFTPDDPQSESKETCKQACVDREDCYAWSFRRPGDCEIFDLGVVAGRAMNPSASDWDEKYADCACGFMVDRIKAERRKQVCDPSFDNPSYHFLEGWLGRIKFNPDRIIEGKPLKDL